MFYEVLTILFFTSTLIDVLYLFFSSWVILKQKNAAYGKSTEGVSVIIAAKNEIDNLTKHLPFILNQNYPSFEVIIASDNSTDGTNEYLSKMAKQYVHLKPVFITQTSDNYNSKKFALNKAIETAKHSILLLTDADCYPASKNWISEMTAQLKSNTEVVLGISPLRINKEKLFQKYQQFENITTAISFLFFSLIKQPYMGVGRNILYRKKSFINVSGFKGIESIKGGDDDLLLQKIMNSCNTVICTSKDSLVYTDPKQTFSSYIKQKLRHYGVGGNYRLKTIISLLMLDLNKTIFYISMVLITFNYFSSTVLFIFFLRMAVFLLYYFLIISKLNVSTAFNCFYIIFDSLYILQRNLLGLLSFFYNPKKW